MPMVLILTPDLALTNDIEYCTDRFDINVIKGKPVHYNEETEETYFPIYED